MHPACQAAAPKLGVPWHIARQCAQPAQRKGQVAEHLPEDLAAENVRLRRENHNIRDTNELLKPASAFASEPGPKRGEMCFAELGGHESNS